MDSPRARDGVGSHLSAADRTCLWFLLEQQMWTIADLLRFAKYTELLSDLDFTVLQKLQIKMENLIKRGRAENAIPET